MNRSELISTLATMTGQSKKVFITQKTSALTELYLQQQNLLDVQSAKPARVKKTTRTCVICNCEKPLSEFGPTHRQVACKGECLKVYSAAARERRKVRLAQSALETPPTYSPVLNSIGTFA